MADRSRTLSYGGWGEDRPSSVITTFYSFKGGVGRTQSLFNVAARIAAVRRNVMMVDVDLEAPGLSIGVLNEEDRTSKEGFADIAYDLLIDLQIAFDESEDVDYLSVIRARYIARIRRALHKVRIPKGLAKDDLARRLKFELNVTIPDDGALYLLSTGRVGDDYTQRVAQLPLAKAYQYKLSDQNRETVRELVEAFEAEVDPDGLRTLGHVFAAMLRETMHAVKVPRGEEAFDHVLVDSRSGLADVGGLCLMGLAETRVVLTGLNEQNVTGTKMVLDDIAKIDDDARDNRHLIVVFSPVPEGELDLLARRLKEAKETLEVNDKQVQLLHYHPRIALEEKAFADPIHKHTRIYQEYENLTDRLLELTGSDAHTLVSHALDEFREAGDDDDRYPDLVDRLIKAVFLDKAHVASVVDGLCTQLAQVEPDEKALPLIDLWVALSPDEIRVLSTTANYYGDVAKSFEEQIETRERLFQRCFALNKTATDIDPKEHRVWNNWGSYLGSFAELVGEDNPARAESLCEESFEKYGRAIDIKPDKYQAWYNWGTTLFRLAGFVTDDDAEHAGVLHGRASEKYQRAVEINPNMYQALGNWGASLLDLYLLRTSHGNHPSDILSEAIKKLQAAIEIQEDETKIQYILIAALAERGNSGDIGAAVDHLRTLLEEDPLRAYDSMIDAYAETFRRTPKLRDILDEYKEKIDVDAEDLDASDVSSDLGASRIEEGLK